MSILLPPPRSLVKATRRLNPAIDLDVDVLAVKSGAGASTYQDWQGPFIVEDSFIGDTGTFLEHHVGETGAAWTQHPTNTGTGAVQISDAGRIFIGSNTASSTLLYYASGVPRTPDYSVQATIRVRSVLAGGQVSVCGRMDVSANTFYGARLQGGGANWQLFKLVAGVGTTLGTVAVSPVIDQDYLLTLKMTGTTIALFVNGVSIISVTDATITAAGRAGVRFVAPTFPIVNTPTTGIQLDDFEVFPAPRLTNTFAEQDGSLRLSETGSSTIFKSAGSSADATVPMPQHTGNETQILWIDFWPDPAVFGPDGFVLDSLDLFMDRNGLFSLSPVFAIHVTRFDVNWNREFLSDPLLLTGNAIPVVPGVVTINFRKQGRTIRIEPGRFLSRTGSGLTSGTAGVERAVNITIEGDNKVSHISVSRGFSIGLEILADLHLNVPYVRGSGTQPSFDVNTFWRNTNPGGKSMGPYSIDAHGASPLDLSKYPGYGYGETGAVPGFGAIVTAQGGGTPFGLWGVSGQVATQNHDHVGSNFFSQPYHVLRAVNYAASGTAIVVLDLGAVPTAEVHFRADTQEPTGTSVTFSVRGSNDSITWSGAWTPIDGAIFTSSQMFRYYEVTATLSGGTGSFTSPILNAVFITERVRFFTWRYTDDFDSSAVLDPTTGQSAIGELKLPLLRLGRGDARDIVTQMVTNYALANIEAWVYIRETISGTRHFLNLFRLEDREPSLGEELLTFVSGMDRLKVMIPQQSETDLYPSDGSNAVMSVVSYDVPTSHLTITVAGAPFAGRTISGWRFDGITGVLGGTSFFILSSPAPTSNTFVITLGDPSQVPTAGDTFQIHSGLTTRTPVDYSGQDFSVVYNDLLANQAVVPSRYRGSLPPGPIAVVFDGGSALTSLTVNSPSQLTFAGTTTPEAAGLKNEGVFYLSGMDTPANNGIQCRVQSIAGSVVNLYYSPLTTQSADSSCTLNISRTASGGLDSNGRAAIDPLQEVALHCGGAPAWSKGRINYIDIYSPKSSVETWSERDYTDLTPSSGASRRMPSITIKYGFDGTNFPFETTFEDADALLGMGRANLFDAIVLPDSLCAWCDASEAEDLGRKMSGAWSTGVRIWRVVLAIPRPWRDYGDCVTISTDQYTDRRLRFTADGITDQGTPVKGRVSAVGVIVGKNLLGTEFDVAILGLNNISSTATSGSIQNFTDSDKTINNLKWTDSVDGTLRTYTWDRGAAVTNVFVYDTLEAAPPTADPWPALGDTPDFVLPVGTDFYTATRPVRGFERYVQLEPRLVDLTSGALRRVVLEPTPPVAPTVFPRIVLSTNRDTADVFLTLDSGDGENVGVSIRDGESGPIHVLCVSDTDTSVRYVTPGTEVGPTDWFFQSGPATHELSAVPLTRDQLKRFYAQAHGQNSLVDSAWAPIPLSLKEQPWLESISVVWDNTTGSLLVRVKGGANCASVFVEVSASNAFTSPATDSFSLADGGDHTSSFALSGTQRGKTWYARATPWNAVALGGLAGVAVIDQTPVPAIYTITSMAATEVTSTGIGTITVVLADPGSVVDSTNKIKFFRTVLGVRTLVLPTTSPGGSTTTGTYTLASTLDPKHNIKVEAIIFLVDGSSTIFGVWTFDNDKVANVVNLHQAVLGASSTIYATFDTDTAIGASNAQYRVDGGAWNALTVASDFTSNFVVALTPALQLIEVQGKDSDGNFGPSVTIQVDALPGFAQGTVTIDTNGVYAWSQDGSTAQASVKYAESTTTFPTDATVRAGTNIINGRQVTRGSGGPLTFGQTVFITIIPYTGSGATGTELPSIRLRGAYQSFSATKVANFAARTLHELTSPPRGVDWDTDNNLIPPHTPLLSSVEEFTGVADIPEGTTITLVEFDVLFPGGLGDTPSISCSLARISSHTRTGLGSVSVSTSGAWQTLSIGLSESVSTGRAYQLEVQFTGIIGSSSAIRLGPMRITYTTPQPTASR